MFVKSSFTITKPSISDGSSQAASVVPYSHTNDVNIHSLQAGFRALPLVRWGRTNKVRTLSVCSVKS
jgi:hypothetical protein